MLQIASFLNHDKAAEDKRAFTARLRRARRQAEKCGLAVVASFGGLTLITTTLDRPRSVHGLAGVSLDAIEQALPPPVRKGPRPIGDDDLDRIIRRAGPVRVLARLDRVIAAERPARTIAAE